MFNFNTHNRFDVTDSVVSSSASALDSTRATVKPTLSAEAFDGRSEGWKDKDGEWDGRGQAEGRVERSAVKHRQLPVLLVEDYATVLRHAKILIEAPIDNCFHLTM